MLTRRRAVAPPLARNLSRLGLVPPQSWWGHPPVPRAPVEAFADSLVGSRTQISANWG